LNKQKAKKRDRYDRVSISFAAVGWRTSFYYDHVAKQQTDETDYAT
jgi:hypothetical protein